MEDVEVLIQEIRGIGGKNPEFEIELRVESYVYHVKRCLDEVLSLDYQLRRKNPSQYLPQRPILTTKDETELCVLVRAYLNSLLENPTIRNQIELIKFYDEPYAASSASGQQRHAIEFILQPLDATTQLIARNTEYSYTIDVSQDQMEVVWKFQIISGAYMRFKVFFISIEAPEEREIVHYPTVYSKGPATYGRYTGTRPGQMVFMWKNQSRFYSRRIQFAIECVSTEMIQAALNASDDTVERTLRLHEIFTTTREQSADVKEDEPYTDLEDQVAILTACRDTALEQYKSLKDEYDRTALIADQLQQQVLFQSCELEEESKSLVAVREERDRLMKERDDWQLKQKDLANDLTWRSLETVELQELHSQTLKDKLHYQSIVEQEKIEMARLKKQLEEMKKHRKLLIQELKGNKVVFATELNQSKMVQQSLRSEIKQLKIENELLLGHKTRMIQVQVDPGPLGVVLDSNYPDQAIVHRYTATVHSNTLKLQQAGISIGSRIVSIDGECLKELSLTEIKTLLRQHVKRLIGFEAPE